MPITMQDIAKKAGVTRSAVSTVFNASSTSRVSAKVRKRILDICRELNYQPNFAASALKKRRTGLIGFICCGLHVPFFSDLTMSITNAAEKRDCRIMLMISPWDESFDVKALDQMSTGMCDGVFICRSIGHEPPEVQEKVRSSTIPIVVLESEFEGFSSICFDYHLGMERAFAELMGNGHRRIAFAGYHTDAAKVNAYRCLCAEYGLEPIEYLCAMEKEHAEVVECGAILARNRERQTAVISTDFVMSIMIQGMDAEGLRIPEDLSVVAFNNTLQSRFFRPGLTAIALDTKTLARYSLDIMLDLIESRSAEAHDPTGNASARTRTVVIPPELVRRKSVRKLA